MKMWLICKNGWKQQQMDCIRQSNGLFFVALYGVPYLFCLQWLAQYLSAKQQTMRILTHRHATEEVHMAQLLHADMRCVVAAETRIGDDDTNKNVK